jgi:hypothetical protein
MHTTIVGTVNPAHLQSNLDALRKGPLSSDLYAEAKRRLAAEHALMRIKARAGGAALTHIEEDRALRAADRSTHVGVGEDDGRRFATGLTKRSSVPTLK